MVDHVERCIKADNPDAGGFAQAYGIANVLVETAKNFSETADDLLKDAKRAAN